jgi:hypothetical protein
MRHHEHHRRAYVAAMAQCPIITEQLRTATCEPQKGAAAATQTYKVAVNAVWLLWSTSGKMI